jgi:hypothetical protein
MKNLIEKWAFAYHFQSPADRAIIDMIVLVGASLILLLLALLFMFTIPTL